MTSIQSTDKDSRKKELLQELALLDNEGEEQEKEPPQEKEEDKPIEKPRKKGGNKTKRNEKQLESLVKGREVWRAIKAKENKIKEENNIIRKQELEKKLIEKAIKIKKKQLKRIEVFDELSDEDTMPQEIQKPKQVKQKQAIQATQQPPQIINPYEVFKNKYNIH
jgi:hypothetical protein